MTVVLLVAAWAVVQSAFVIAAVVDRAPKPRPSIFAGLSDVRL